MRRCECCGIEKPAGQFRLRRRGMPDRATECRRCHADTERTRRRRRRARKLQRITSQIVQAEDLDQIHRLATNLIERFGGVRRLAALYHQTVEAARAADPGSPTVASMLLAILKVRVFCDLSGWGDADPAGLDGKREQLTREIVLFNLEHPMVAASCLTELGYSVVPPVRE